MPDNRRKIGSTLGGYRVIAMVKKILYRIIFYSLVIGLCFAILYPLLKLLPVVFNNVEDLGNPDVIWIPIKFSLVSFKAAIRLAFGNGITMLESLGYAITISIIQIFISAMAGYALGRVKFWGRNFIFFLVILTFVVPPQSLLISQYLSFKHFDVFGLVTLINGSTIDIINKPYTLYIIALLGFGVKQNLFIFIFRQFFKGLPNELEEAALIDGCGFYKTFLKVALPNAVPAIMTVGILGFVWNYGDTYYTGYFNPNGPYLSNTLSKTFIPANSSNILYAIRTWYDVPGAGMLAYDAVKQAAALLYLIPLLVVYFIIQRHIIENFEQSGIVG
ncbi:MAG: carbohydrate ABC transporter permease [Clostridiales bacterium]|nr:carbohydrate ABC transporter permease [Clostridiales bacterium]